MNKQRIDSRVKKIYNEYKMNQIPFAFSWVYLSFISIPTIHSFNFSPSLIITPPGTTLLGSNENISVPNAKHVEIGSLNDVQKIVQDEFTQHDLVLSFTKHDDYLRRFSVDAGEDNVGTTIYGFGETIRDLVSHFWICDGVKL